MRRVPREPRGPAALQAWESLDRDSRHFVVDRTRALKPVDHPLAAAVQADLAGQMLRRAVMRAWLFGVAAAGVLFLFFVYPGGMTGLLVLPFLITGVSIIVEILRLKQLSDGRSSTSSSENQDSQQG